LPLSPRAAIAASATAASRFALVASPGAGGVDGGVSVPQQADDGGPVVQVDDRGGGTAGVDDVGLRVVAFMT